MDKKEERTLCVGILGCTGTVGQRFCQLLENHPWFRITCLGASPRSAGKLYGKQVKWKLNTPIPEALKSIEITTCESKHFQDADIIFSALDSSVAGPVETEFAEANFPVFSNAKNHRTDPDVPILIPYVNGNQLETYIGKQRENKGYDQGFIVTNANCSSTGLAIALAPLHRAFSITKLFVVTLQAISGAGYPGVSAFDIVDNVYPFIDGEEPKLESEPHKILGAWSSDNSEFIPADFKVSATCNRVNCLDGHTECVSIEFKSTFDDQGAITADRVAQVLSEFNSDVHADNLPSAPPMPVVVLEDNNRPQPRLDRDLNGGFVCTVGRIRKCPLFNFKFTLCSHNTIIGAAGGSILNAELAYRRNLI